MSDADFTDVIADLDARVADVAGHGFETTPCGRSPMLEGALGGVIWVKDETGQVGDSHKARHLMGIALDLQVRARLGQDLPSGPLAIASCGNAALAAAVVARAWGKEIQVFIPSDASRGVVERLTELGAKIEICTRRPGVAGDPCVHAFRAAVEAGAVPFCCQGPDNGLTIEGGQTLAWELARTLATEGSTLDRLFVQVGGGALATSTIQGLMTAIDAGFLTRLPAIHAVQTEGCYPLARAYDLVVGRIWQRLGETRPASALESAERLVGEPDCVEETVAEAVEQRAVTMWPWEETPTSLAHGILDDETYDWRAIVLGMLQTGGYPIVVNNADLKRAKTLADAANPRPVCYTGASGLAGLLRWMGERSSHPGASGVIFSGRGRALGA